MPKFETGNKFWMNRSEHGRDKLFSDPKVLWEEACKYFEATDARKWVKKDWVGKDAMEVKRESETPYSKSGLALFLDCDWRTIESLKADANPDFLHIITRIEQIIYTQKIEGATVGAFNANIVARELGMADNANVNHGGQRDNPIIVAPLTADRMKELDSIFNLNGSNSK